MAYNPQLMLAAIVSNLEAKIATSTANLMIYIENPVGIGEHGNVVEEAIKHLEDINKYKSQLNTFNELFGKNNVNK